MWLFGFIVGSGAGGVAVWFGKDTIQAWVLGAESFAASLQSKINALTPAPKPPVPPTPPKV